MTSNPYNDVLPSADDIAGALNRLAAAADSHTLLSQAAIGAIAGVTTVLDTYWAPPAGSVLFPYPSMVGSGDRMAIAWAVTGLTPDLSLGIDPPPPDALSIAARAWISTRAAATIAPRSRSSTAARARTIATPRAAAASSR